MFSCPKLIDVYSTQSFQKTNCFLAELNDANSFNNCILLKLIIVSMRSIILASIL